ncbi:MAG: tRNA threonylcarbamoyladenosine dehydratase [Spirochaetaceae bacterium]|nr:tRNA threonylcarbamoyladenosine dehydratase [Spirochaetaceae bacterium]
MPYSILAKIRAFFNTHLDMTNYSHAAVQRLALITGDRVIEALTQTQVMVFGLGGVGSWCAEALVRCGIGRIVLIDSDRVCITNINRQVQATYDTIGELKADALKSRLLKINPDSTITALNKIFSEDNEAEFHIEETDFVIDAIDSLSCKIALIEKSAALGKTFFSSMGMAQKLDPTLLKTGDIWETTGCPLARLVRSQLRRRNFTGHFTVVYSMERLPIHKGVQSSCGSTACLCPSKSGSANDAHEWCSSKKVINGSAVPVTAAAGMVLASLVIQNVRHKYE